MRKKRSFLPSFSRWSTVAVGLIVWAAGPTAAQSPRGQEPPGQVTVRLQATTDKTFTCPYCDMAGADLSGRDLTNANLTGAVLARANLKGTILNGAALIGADLSHATLDNARLNDSAKGHADLSRANLTGASFRGAEMNGTNLQFAQMHGADFSNLDLTRAVFGPRIKVGVAGSRKTSFRNARLRNEFAVDAATMDAEGAQWERAAAAPETDDIVCGRADLSGLTSRIYVADTGTDSDTCGTSSSSPCKTIGRGISRCAASGCGVLVAWDEYRPADTLALRDGVNVYGGCLPRNQSRPDYFSAVMAPDGGRPVASAPAIKGRTILQGFQLNASAASGTSAAVSVALLVKDSSGLSVLDTELVANRGGQGGTAAPGADGTAGGNGSGRDGGTVGACASTSGGKGAVRMDVSASGCFEIECKPSCSENSCWGYDGWSGTTGRSAKGGQWGNGNCAECPRSRGEKGKTGDAGSHASCGFKGAPSGDTSGVFRGDNWTASAGGTGGSGGNGGGGGGGGAGGFRAGTCFCVKTQDPGNSGGGGGAGGCQGGRGGGGQQGGASFALLALRSTVALTRCDIVAGTGGAGGNGGAGGRGGRGGSGAGGATNEAGGYGGDGGNGGAGGASGGGAGGNGGPAIGAALVGGSTINGSALVYYPGQSGNPGEGGAGGGAIVTGACTAPNGDNGAPGRVADTQTY